MIEIIAILSGLALMAPAIWMLRRSPRVKTAPEYSPTVSLVLDMLSNGRDWKVDSFRASHSTGASIWIANSPASSGLSLDGDAWPHTSGRVGNVSTTEAERKALFAAAKALGERRQAEQFAEATVEWAERVKHYADNVVNIRGAA